MSLELKPQTGGVGDVEDRYFAVKSAFRLPETVELDNCIKAATTGCGLMCNSGVVKLRLLERKKKG